MSLLNLDAIRSTPLVTEPFVHFVADAAVPETNMDGVLGDYPKIQRGGSFPQNSVTGGEAFNQLCEELLHHLQ